MIVVPDALAGVTTAREGEVGAEWIARLPSLVEELVAEWDLEIDGPPRHGQVAIVVPVRRGGEELALKASFPHEGNRSEPDALRAFDGHGAVRLHASDPTRFAMLVERAGDRTPAEVIGVDAWLEVAADIARRLARPAPAGAPSLAASAGGRHEDLDRALAALPPEWIPTPRADRAREALRHLADDRTATLVHGDLHARNVLEATRMPWLAIDPKGYRGPIGWDAFTIGITPVESLLAEPSPLAELERRIRRFAGLAGIDADATLELASARMLSSLLHELGSTRDRPARRSLVGALLAEL